jgi:hypothetical protein
MVRTRASSAHNSPLKYQQYQVIEGLGDRGGGGATDGPVTIFLGPDIITTTASDHRNGTEGGEQGDDDSRDDPDYNYCEDASNMTDGDSDGDDKPA